MRVSRILLSLFLITTCLGQLGNVNLGPLPGMQFTNRTHRLGRGLIAYYPFNERSGVTAFDLSGNGNTGTFGAGAASPSWSSGKFGSATIYDGGDYIDCGLASNILVAHPSTRIVWFRQTSETRAFLLTGTSPNLDLQVWNDSTVYFEGSGDQYKFTYTYDAEQHCIAIVDTGTGNTGYAAYLDGVLQSISISGVSSTTQNNFLIGNRDGTDRGMIGLIDLVMIYSRVLSAGEIAELYRVRDSWMFKRGDIELMAKSVEAPPAGGGQFIMIQMSMIPLLFIFTLVCFIRGKEIGK